MFNGSVDQEILSVLLVVQIPLQNDLWGFIKKPLLSITSSGEKGILRAKGSISYQKATGIFDNPQI